MLVSELISSAYYLSNVVAREYETVSGEQTTDGLTILNDLLASFAARGFFIPYDSHTQVNTTAGVTTYAVPNLAITDDVTFTIGNVVYPMVRGSKRDQWGDARILNVSSLPHRYYVERSNGGSTIYLYFAPTADVEYLTVTGKFALTNVTLSTELNNTYDRFYQVFLKYNLADWLCDFYDHMLPANVERKKAQLNQELINISSPDFTIKKVSTLETRGAFNYAQANIGKGWTAP